MRYISHKSYVTVYHKMLIKSANTILSYRPKYVCKLHLGFKDTEPEMEQAVNPLLNVLWLQTVYSFKAKDMNYLNM